MNFDKQLELLRNKAKQIKYEENKQKQLDHFNKSFVKFYECLSSEFSYDPETKSEIKKKLIKLIQLIENVIEKYLN